MADHSKRRSPIQDRVVHFWSRVDRSKGDNGCWPWLGGRKGRNGYGEFWDGEKRTAPHRHALALSGVAIPDGAFVCHSCDHKLCCNTAHLYVGDHASNMRDSAERKRHRRGDEHYMRVERRACSIPLDARERGEDRYNAKLNKVDVEAIRAEYASGNIGHRALAAKFGVSPTAIGNVLARRRWAHVQ